MEAPKHAPNKLSELDALFLDVGGTLIYPRHGVANSYARYAAEMGVTLVADGLDQAFLDSYVSAKKSTLRKTGLTFGASETDGRRFWRDVFNPLLPHGLDAGTADALFESIYAGFENPDEWAIFEDAERLMASAQAKGIPMVVVSNWDTRLPALLDAMGLTQRMTGIVCSAVVGIEKPSQAIFEKAQSLLPEAIRKGKIMMVGDSHREDIEGARRFGLETLHVHRGTGDPAFPNMVARIDSIVD
jgi:putative hydrolase of the HAD superfamily